MTDEKPRKPRTRKRPDDIPNVIPESDDEAPDFRSLEEVAPKQALSRTKEAPNQSLVNINLGGGNRRGIVDESAGPRDSERELDPGDIFGSPSDEERFNPLSELLSAENINMKSDLTDGLIIALARCEVAASLFDVPELKDVCHAIKTMRVSRGRKGRIEVVEAIKGHPPQDGATTFMQKLKTTLHS